MGESGGVLGGLTGPGIGAEERNESEVEQGQAGVQDHAQGRLPGRDGHGEHVDDQGGGGENGTDTAGLAATRAPQQPGIVAQVPKSESGRVSKRSVDARPVVDPHDLNSRGRFIDPVHDQIGTTPSDRVTAQLPCEGFANSMWVLEKWSKHELDDRDGDLHLETGEIPLRRGSHSQSPVGHSVPRYVARISSPVR
jgi:hypothetical protein